MSTQPTFRIPGIPPRLVRAIATFSSLLVIVGALSIAPASAEDPPADVVTEIPFTTSDGVRLQTTLTGRSPMVPRPTIVEFSPYGDNSQSTSPGPDFNVLLVQIRGTGDSDGTFDALGPRNQADVPEVLRWACDQEWSNGSLGLNGFSASAIMLYNSMHLTLPCVKTMVLKSGTLELYRDLLSPGGMTNLIPGIGVLALIGAPALMQGPARLQRNPASSLDTIGGLMAAGLNVGLLHPTLDSYWKERGFRGDVNKVPILMIDGFFDVESRGAFQGYQELRDNGAHLVVVGAHDGAPVGTDGGAGEAKAWFEHYLRGVDNGVESHPRVQMLMSDGDRKAMLDGDFIRRDAADWPVPGTTWNVLNLDATPSRTPKTPHDGSLTLGPAALAGTRSYVSLPTVPFNSDPPNTAILGALTNQLPIGTDMALAEALGLSFTTAPLGEDVYSAGPASLEVSLSSTAPETGIWAVLTDVAPDGTSHALTAGRLLSSFPNIDRSKSLIDNQGKIVQPYSDFSKKTPLAGFLKPLLYHVEFWPIGNRFKKGHRIRLDIVGASAASMPTVPGLNSVRVGGTSGSRLLFPVLPESNLASALGE